MAESNNESAPKRGPGKPFPPGVSGNPGGKNPERERLRRLITTEYGQKAIEGIWELATNAESEKVRFEAHRWLAEQVIGKPAQAVTDAEGGPLRFGVVMLPAPEVDGD